MSLFQYPGLIDRLDSINNNLQRIADACDRAWPPLHERDTQPRKKLGPEAIIRYGQEDQSWARDEFKELIHGQGLSPEQEKEALDEVMKRFSQAPFEDL